MQLDDTDRRVLRHYLAEPSLGRADLAERAGVTAATLWRRLERLREAGLFALTGSTFGAPYADHLRLCFGRPAAEMAEIQRRIEASGLLEPL